MLTPAMDVSGLPAVAAEPAPTHPALLAFSTRNVADPAGARAELLEALRRAGGPLVRPEAPGTVRVTFVAVGPTRRPFVRCALFPGLVASEPMLALPGADDIWWLDVVAPEEISVSYQYQRFRVRLPAADDGSPSPAELAKFAKSWQRAGFADSANPASHPFEEPAEVAVRTGRRFTGAGRSGARAWESELTLPGAAPYPWHNLDAPPGTTTYSWVASTILGNERTVAVWMPPDPPDYPMPAIVLLDGEAMHGARARIELIFANLVASGSVPPFVGVLAHNATETSRMTEYPCNADFASFLADELMPRLRRSYPIATEPERVAIGGFSYGGLAADFAALTRPDVFGAALSMSASLWWGIRPRGAADGDHSQGHDDQPRWLTRQVTPAGPGAPRFWLDVGQLENAPISHAAGLDMVTTNREFREVLQANGYQVVGYREQPGGHDLFNWRRTLPDGLIALFGEH
jgi:enterochelin esterase-like enzyme